MAEQEPEIYFGSDSLSRIPDFIFSDSFSQIFVLIDENTHKHCYPKLKTLLPPHHIIKIVSGEENKTLSSCETIWKKLTDKNADRESLLINLGGGVISDIGGFAAGCYKRGIKFINVPTTLLAMVDASVGGKTGVDFLNYKNQLGLFNDPEAVFIYTGFLKTLPDRELIAAFAEVVKHYMIADEKAFYELSEVLLQFLRKEFDIRTMDWDVLVERNVFIKSQIVAQDKFEADTRKALNFGHTIGHAIETYYLNAGKKVLHGEAIAIGIICEARFTIDGPMYGPVLGCFTCLFENLPTLPMADIPEILRLIKQDKKNSSGQNQFTFVPEIGCYSVNNCIEESKIIEVLEDHSEITEIHDPNSTPE